MGYQSDYRSHTAVELTFDPQAPARPKLVALPTEGELNGVACPSRTQCTAVGESRRGWGAAVTFNPIAPRHPVLRTLVARDDQFNQIACPSRTQCTAVDGDLEVTFDPLTRAGHIGRRTIGDAGYTVVCPSRTQCTAIGSERQDSDGSEATFDPRAPHDVLPVVIDRGVGGVLLSLACPSRTQCTATDAFGRAVTFNPASPTHATRETIRHKGSIPRSGISQAACPSRTQCVALGTLCGAGGCAGETAVSFNPTQPSHRATVANLDRNPTTTNIACPSSTQCTVIDYLNVEVTFNPKHPSQQTRAPIAPATSSRS